MAPVKSLRPLACTLVATSLLVIAPAVHAQSEPEPKPADTEAVPSQAEPTPAPPHLHPVPPEPPASSSEVVAPTTSVTEEPPPAMSEGRALVSAYNSGFQWGIAPGVVFSRGKAGFAVGLRFGYGFDTGPVILVPGVRLAGYFLDPNVYVGMPTFKLVLPIDRFAPFVEGGAGAGHVAADGATGAKTGLALMGGGGFMIHFSRIAFGAEASYQVITGTGFKGFGVGPILAIGF